MQKKYNESDIRDYLSSNISVLEDELTLIGKEIYIPSEICTKSFIDLVARDKNNKMVLIEVKKTASASRETLHEILKYIEAVKNHLGFRENEMRVIVASVEWSELIVPFSSFVKRIDCDVKGVALIVGEKGVVLSASDVNPIQTEAGRIFSPYYEFQFVENIKRRDLCVASFKRMCIAKNIESYVLLVLRCPDKYKDGLPSQKQITMRSLIAEMATAAGPQLNDIPMPRYKFIICFAMQQLSVSGYLARFSSDEARNEANDIVHSYEEEEALWFLHDSLMALEPFSVGDFKDIGSSNKLKSDIIEKEGWVKDNLIRHGFLARNNLLSDQTIIDELCGSTGTSLQVLDMEFNPNNKSELAELRRRVDVCLRDNPSWKSQIHEVLDCLVENKECRNCRIHVYNPSSALTTIYMVASQEGGILSVPTYHIDVPKTNIEKMFYGYMKKVSATRDSLSDLLIKYYSNSLDELLFTLNWGGYESRDTDIMRSLGLRYRTAQVEIDEDKRAFKELDEGRWMVRAPHNFIDEYFEFLEENGRLVGEICEAYSSHWDGRVVRF